MKNEQAVAHSLPAWLDGSTIAIISAIVGTGLTVGIGLGMMLVTSNASLRAHIDTRIADVDTRITGVETSLNRRIDDVNKRIDDGNTRIDGLATRIDGLADRLRIVEIAVAEIRVHLGLLHRPALPDDGTEAKEETFPPDAALGTAREPTS